MWTRQYKGLFIHGYFHKDECSVVIASENGFGIGTLGTVKSYRAAQVAITKYLKKS